MITIPRSTPLVLVCLISVAFAAESDDGPGFQLVESVPVETTLGQPDLPRAPDVWLEMIQKARTEICVASFYFSDDPDDDDDPLDRVLKALAEAGARGVRVQMLSDKGFHKTYPDIPDRFDELPGCESRLLDARTAWGGVLHAKYMVVDGQVCFVGSQNWDWRALKHIHELGARIRDEALAGSLRAVFRYDWALAGNEPVPEQAVDASARTLTLAGGGTVTVTMAASPPQALPVGLPHDLPRLRDLVDRAEHELRLQVLSYHVTDRDGAEYLELDTALRRAAGRGVQVRIIASNWAKRPSQAVWLQSLACLPGIEVRFTNIPPWSGGFVPFGRVEHPKYMVIDGSEGWVSTSNWGPGYFSDSRNVSLFVAGAETAMQLTRIFETSWNSEYAETVDPGRKDYEAPRRQE